MYSLSINFSISRFADTHTHAHTQSSYDVISAEMERVGWCVVSGDLGGAEHGGRYQWGFGKGFWGSVVFPNMGLSRNMGLGNRLVFGSLRPVFQGREIVCKAALRPNRTRDFVCVRHRQ